MKAQELRAMAPDELSRKIDELFQELFNLRFQKATRQLSNTSRMRLVRRDIARAQTILRELQTVEEVQ